jgi:transcriptional regulator with XRE-family HTH domain
MDDDRSLAARIGARLRNQRRNTGMTLAKLAEHSGVSVSYLSAVEKGVNLPSLQTLARIAEALGVTIPAVLAEEGQTHVQRGRVPASGESPVDAAHPLLQLRVTILHANPGEQGAAPLPTDDRDLFVYVRDGRLTVTLPTGDYTLHSGDALDAKNPGPVAWTSEARTVAVFTTCPTRVA